MDLPIDAILPQLIAALRSERRAVLQAPPGAGKTTRVPLALHQAGLAPGKIVMLEPRRIAARAAADRLAQSLPKGAVGYRMRGDSQAGSAIEVVTEGILTRMIQSDPELPGVGTVIFDEFHERSLVADLGLALTLELREALRPDLCLLVMSATLDAAPVAELMGDAPVITSQGRSHPVTLHWLDQPLRKGARLAQATADLTRKAVAETKGGVLVFLPGVGEINRVQGLLDGSLPGDVRVLPLHGGLPLKAQRAAIAAGEGRKIVLATNIAETSLTIDGIRTVVDAGRARRLRFDPGSGMSRLVTEPVTRAEALQRAGRAGRVAPGDAYRLWTKPQEGALPAHPEPEIATADLTGLALELAQWGSDSLPFLTPPPPGALAEARGLLTALGCLNGGSITAHGRDVAAMPLHPRLAHMLVVAGRAAAPLAAVLSDKDLMRGVGCDLSLRLRAVRDGDARADKGALSRLRAEAKRLSGLLSDRRDAGGSAGNAAGGLSAGQMLALAYPDMIGLRRPGDAPRYLLSGGRGAVLPAEDGLAGARFIVAADVDGAGREATVRLALPLTESELRDIPGVTPKWTELCQWSARDRAVVARKEERLGALVLATRKWQAPPEQIATALCEGLRQVGLRLSPAARRLQARAALVTDVLTDEALLADIDDWLAPYLVAARSIEDVRALDLTPALEARLGWDVVQQLNREAPGAWQTPLGRSIPIDYSGDVPEITLRLQEMFGTTQHPVVAGQPLRVTLLSPAGRPVQVTMDIPGFWASSYADVRKDMRGRYPKHPWPEDPTQADPTLRTKRR